MGNRAGRRARIRSKAVNGAYGPLSGWYVPAAGRDVVLRHVQRLLLWTGRARVIRGLIRMTAVSPSTSTIAGLHSWRWRRLWYPEAWPRDHGT